MAKFVIIKITKLKRLYGYEYYIYYRIITMAVIIINNNNSVNNSLIIYICICVKIAKKAQMNFFFADSAMCTII